MPIEVDTSEAPALLRYRFIGPWPTVEEQSRVREKLIADGHLTAKTVALMDARELTSVADEDAIARTVAADAARRVAAPSRLLDRSRKTSTHGRTIPAAGDDHRHNRWILR